ncbi:uncharacterized protein V1518DRAFT_421590 [Limtongia smithiae]|uniref:uncharacterized protein n=1 Tax=Limtongia smithiae TaxID=1125753 RepID=UPI0034CF85A6
MHITLDIPTLHREYEILHLIQHHYKNQYRLARWWKYVSLVHRNLRRLIVAGAQMPSQPRGGGALHNARAAQAAMADASPEIIGKIMEKRRKRHTKRQLYRRRHGRMCDRPLAVNVVSTAPYTYPPEDDTLVYVNAPLSHMPPSPTTSTPTEVVETAEALVYHIIPRGVRAFQRIICENGGRRIKLALVLIACVAKVWGTLRKDTRAFRPTKRVLLHRAEREAAKAALSGLSGMGVCGDVDFGEIVGRGGAVATYAREAVMELIEIADDDEYDRGGDDFDDRSSDILEVIALSDDEGYDDGAPLAYNAEDAPSDEVALHGPLEQGKVLILHDSDSDMNDAPVIAQENKPARTSDPDADELRFF